VQTRVLVGVGEREHAAIHGPERRVVAPGDRDDLRHSTLLPGFERGAMKTLGAARRGASRRTDARR
jgi:hypothetical protein